MFPGCISGKWGDNCANTCSENCLEQGCNIQTGSCGGGCREWYTGKFCDRYLRELKTNKDTFGGLLVPLETFNILL